LSDQFSTQFSAALRVFVGIVRLKKGPQDLPVSAPLLLSVIVLSVVPDLVISALGPATGANLAFPLAVEIIFTLLWYAGMLRIAGKPERFFQTATAVFGVQVILAPLLVFAGWFVSTYHDDPNWQVPASFVALIVAIWVLVILVRILRAATEWPMFACLLVTVISQFVALQLIASLLPAAPAAAG
jgi:hypothetical protein